MFNSVENYQKKQNKYDDNEGIERNLSQIQVPDNESKSKIDMSDSMLIKSLNNFYQKLQDE